MLTLFFLSASAAYRTPPQWTIVHPDNFTPGVHRMMKLEEFHNKLRVHHDGSTFREKLKAMLGEQKCYLWLGPTGRVDYAAGHISTSAWDRWDERQNFAGNLPDYLLVVNIEGPKAENDQKQRTIRSSERSEADVENNQKQKIDADTAPGSKHQGENEHVRWQGEDEANNVKSSDKEGDEDPTKEYGTETQAGDVEPDIAEVTSTASGGESAENDNQSEKEEAVEQKATLKNKEEEDSSPSLGFSILPVLALFAASWI